MNWKKKDRKNRFKTKSIKNQHALRKGDLFSKNKFQISKIDDQLNNNEESKKKNKMKDI